MFESIASIDIGTSSIKIVTARTGIKDFNIKNFIYEDIELGDNNTDETLSELLMKLISENGLKDHKILINLPMQNAIIRNLSFPFNDREKISEIIPFEAEENIPFSLEEVVLDFQMLKSKEPGSGEVLLAASRKESVQHELSLFNKSGVNPIHMGLESQAIFECYRYFNKIQDEAIIQLDIGNNKTILNFIHSNNLLSTRSIAIGAGTIYNRVSESFNLSRKEVVNLFENYNFDLTSFENNLQKDYQNDLKVKKNTIKGVYDKSIEIVVNLIEQIILTKKAFLNEYPEIVFSRVLISGGGSSINGIGTIISGELELPVVAIPFFEDYTEAKIRSQFPMAFGIILSYLNKKYSAISFLKGEFTPVLSTSSIKQYYLAAGFTMLTLIVILINIIVTSYLKSESNEQYKNILNSRFKKYFHARRPSEDPISDAMKMLNEEKKELESIESVVRSNENIMNIFNDVLSFFPKDDSFELKNLVINESVIRLDAKIGSSVKIDEFKNKLTESKKFDNVTVNTNIKKGNDVLFSMTIKLIVPGKPTGKAK